MMILWRADDRAPGDIYKAGGFYPRSARPRDIIINDFCHAFAVMPNDHARQHVFSPNSDYVSTGIDKGCGGYDHKKYIYQLEVPLTEQPIDNISLSFTGPMKPQKKSLISAKLLLSGPTVELSELIAIKQPKEEITFVTPILLKYIKKFKRANSNKWEPF